jgi:hypothetical protein
MNSGRATAAFGDKSMPTYQAPKDWNYNAPKLDISAIATAYRIVENTLAVDIKNGSYRNSKVDGVFELAGAAEKGSIRILPSGKRKVNVVCSWFDGMPPSRDYIQIDVTDARIVVQDNYNGEVVRDLGRS